MPYKFLRKYGEAGTINFPLFESDGINFRSDAAFEAGDLKIMKDEGAEGNTSNLPTDEGQGYSEVLTAAELTAKRIVIYLVDQTGIKIWLDDYIIIETYGHANAMHAFNFDYDLSGNNEDWKFNSIDIQGSGVGLNIQSTANNAVNMESMGGGGNGVVMKGHGSGSGLKIQSGVTGNGLEVLGGATSGDGIKVITTDGHGININVAANNTMGININASGGVGAGGINVSTTGSGISVVGGIFGMIVSGAMAGLRLEGGSTGDGIQVLGGSTSGNGIDISTTNGHGIDVAALGAGKSGASISGTIGLTLSAGVSMPALNIMGGVGGFGIAVTEGVRFSAGTNKPALELLGNGTGAGLEINGGLTGNGITIAGGATSGRGIKISTTSGHGIDIDVASGHGIDIDASSNGITIDAGDTALKASGAAGAEFKGTTYSGMMISSTGYIGLEITAGDDNPGIYCKGGPTGHGAEILGGATSGNGLDISTTDGHGINIANLGSKNAIEINSSQHGINITSTTHGIVIGAGGLGIDINSAGPGIDVNSSAAAAMVLAGSSNGLSITSSGAPALSIGSTVAPGVYVRGSTSSGNGAGVDIKGGGTGAGVYCEGGVTNGKGVHIAGIGSGAGLFVAGGLTGAGMDVYGGLTSGDALKLSTTNGVAFSVRANGTTKEAMLIESLLYNAINVRGGTSAVAAIDVSSNEGIGIRVLGHDGPALHLESGGNFPGVYMRGTNAYPGLHCEGGAAGDGAIFKGGTTSGRGMRIYSPVSGNGLEISTTDGIGLKIAAAGTDKQSVYISSSNSHGIEINASTIGDGIKIGTGGGAGINIITSGGHAISAVVSGGTDHNGIYVKGFGPGAGLKTEGGSTGNGIDVIGGVGTGKGINVTTTNGIAFDMTAGGSNKDIDAKEIDLILTNLQIVDDVVDAILVLTNTIDGKVDIIGTGVVAIVAKLPIGTISDLALTDLIDGVTFEKILEYVMSMYNGNFDEDVPAPGQRTFYKRDGVTVLSIVKVDDSGRERIS